MIFVASWHLHQQMHSRNSCIGKSPSYGPTFLGFHIVQFPGDSSHDPTCFEMETVQPQNMGVTITESFKTILVRSSSLKFTKNLLDSTDALDSKLQKKKWIYIKSKTPKAHGIFDVFSPQKKNGPKNPPFWGFILGKRRLWTSSMRWMASSVSKRSASTSSNEAMEIRKDTEFSRAFLLPKNVVLFLDYSWIMIMNNGWNPNENKPHQKRWFTEVF